MVVISGVAKGQKLVAPLLLEVEGDVAQNGRCEKDLHTRWSLSHLLRKPTLQMPVGNMCGKTTPEGTV